MKARRVAVVLVALGGVGMLTAAVLVAAGRTPGSRSAAPSDTTSPPVAPWVLPTPPIGSTAASPTAASPTAEPPSRQPHGTNPVPCLQERYASETCFPGVSISAVRDALAERGARCEANKFDVTCTDGPARNNADVTMRRAFRTPDKLVGLAFRGSAGGDGPHAPEAEQRAIDNLVTVLRATLPIVLPGAPDLHERIIAWVLDTMDACPDTFDPHTIIDTYEIRCRKGKPVTISGEKGTVTNWLVGAWVEAPRSPP